MKLLATETCFVGWPDSHGQNEGGRYIFFLTRKFLMRMRKVLWDRRKHDPKLFFSDKDVPDVGEFYGSIFFCVGYPSVCLHGTMRPGSCIHVVVEAPHVRRSRCVCNATIVCSTHRNILEARNLGVCTHYYYSCTLLESLFTVYTVYGLNLAPTHNTPRKTARVGPLPCAPTCNRGMAQYVFFDRFGLAQPYECSWQAATCHANSAVQAASNSI